MTPKNTETARAAQRLKNHLSRFQCGKCKKICRSSRGLKLHKIDVHSHECPQCSARCADEWQLQNHQKSKQHCYCDDCDRSFSSSVSLKAHLQSSLHSAKLCCRECDRSFTSYKALGDHLRFNVHNIRPKKTTTIEVRHRRHESLPTAAVRQCPKCTRKFKRPIDLNRHLASAAHHPLGEVRCIAGTRCKMFASTSAVLHHLESGACPSGMDHGDLRRLVAKRDNREFTSDFQGDHLDLLRTPTTLERHRQQRPPSTFDSGSEMLLHAQSTVTLVASTSSETDSSEWTLVDSTIANERCPICGPEFRCTAALRNHSTSPVHQEQLIICPTRLADGGGDLRICKAFKTLSGLVQHLESGACYGGIDSLKKIMSFLEQQLGLTPSLRHS